MTIRPQVVLARLAHLGDVLAGLRNLLVHDHAELDAARLWQLATTRLDDLRGAQAAFAALPELRR